jgi:hypothetical protein
MKKEELSFLSSLDAPDREAVSYITRFARARWWERVLDIAALPSVFVLFGAFVYSVPLIWRKLEMTLCRQHGSMWFPEKSMHESLEKFLFMSGCFFVCAAILSGALNWVWARRHRRVYEILCKAFPAGMDALKN